MRLRILLLWAREMTEKAQAQAGVKWSLEAQIKKTSEELGELHDAIPWSKDVGWMHLSNAEEKAHVIDEFWDTVLSNLTLMHILGLTDSEISLGLLKAMRKLDLRLEGDYFKNLGSLFEEKKDE